MTIYLPFGIIHNEVWSENQDDKYYYELIEDCNHLAENQSLGEIYNQINTEIFGYKSGQHILFYRKLSETEIEITRFLHSRMDLKKQNSRITASLFPYLLLKTN